MSRMLGMILLLLLGSVSLVLAQAPLAAPAATVTTGAPVVAPVITPAVAPVIAPPMGGAPILGAALMAGDTVTVSVPGEPAITGSYTVRDDGRIVFPVAGSQQVTGLTPMQLADRLTAALRPFVVDPVVAVTAISGAPRTVSVVGDVARPGSYDHRQACNLNALMALCGGCTSGDLKGATLVRRGELMAVVPDGQREPENLSLEAGDVLTVPSRVASVINVAGAVKTPAALPLSTCNSAGKALVLCGGPTPEGDASCAYIMRDNQRLPVNLASYTNGQTPATPDVPLQPGDVVMVPQKTESGCYVLGEVKTPGPQVMTRPVRVSTALAQAGGLSADADGSRAYILRSEKKVPVNLTSLLQDGDGQSDVALIAGDVVVVPKSTGLVYVMGQVTKPGPLPLSSAPTALAAWGLAGGGTLDADVRSAMLLRGTECLPLNLEALDRGETRLDVALQPGDRIMVPKYSRMMYVLGQVNKPGTHPIAQGDTLLDVIARAGGPTGLAAADSIAIVRKTPANCTPVIECAPGAKGRQELPADKVQKALQAGLTIKFVDLARAQMCTDEMLAQPGDLIYVPALKQRRVDWLQVLVTLGAALLVN